MNNRQRRDQEMLYLPDHEIVPELLRARRLVQQLNAADRTDFAALRRLTDELLGYESDAMINPPFFCDYGTHIHVGKNFFANYNCTLLDVAPITTGDNCLLAPNVSIYTAGHPLHPDVRSTGYEYGAAVTIGDNVWIGGSVVICPGVRIGSNTVIGAGSVVTKDIPDWVVAAGNPCRVLRAITEEDRGYYFRGRPIDEEAQRHIGAALGR